jgi:hypothetical protein
MGVFGPVRSSDKGGVIDSEDILYDLSFLILLRRFDFCGDDILALIFVDGVFVH